MLDHEGLDEAANLGLVPTRAYAAPLFTANMPRAPISGVVCDIPDEATLSAAPVSRTFMGKMMGIAIGGDEYARTICTLLGGKSRLRLAWPFHSHTATIYAS